MRWSGVAGELGVVDQDVERSEAALRSDDRRRGTRIGDRTRRDHRAPPPAEAISAAATRGGGGASRSLIATAAPAAPSRSAIARLMPAGARDERDAPLEPVHRDGT
jgi:hypothetical protein